MAADQLSGVLGIVACHGFLSSQDIWYLKAATLAKGRGAVGTACLWQLLGMCGHGG